MIEIITGDLLLAPEKYIVHQTNCVSTGRAAGLAYFLFKQFPYADCYKDRVQSSVPGTIDIRGNGEDQRYVVNLMGQYLPGNFDDKSDTDTQELRKKYFHQGLLKLTQVDKLESVAFPYLISCGIAGGDWNWYKGEISNFSEYVSKKFGIKVFIYQREEDL